MSIDEMMIRSHSRSQNTVKMPSKPIKKDYQMWALSERVYMSNFIYTSPPHGTGELQSHPDLTDLGSMVAQLGELFPKDVEFPPLYLDNYFTSISLFRLLRDRGIGATETILAKRTSFHIFCKHSRTYWKG